MTTSRRLYRGLTALLWPVLRWHAAREARRAGEPDYPAQRRGRYADTVRPGGLWVHAASVGEVRTVRPLLEALQAARPGLAITLTTSTPTGGQAARLIPGIQVLFLPLDRPRPVRRFLAAVRPEAGLVVETELWPELFAACRHQGVPLAIVNGRLSHRTLRAPRLVLALYREALAGVTVVLARSEADAAGYRSLGAPAERVQVVGNLKFAGPAEAAAPAAVDLGRRYVLAASTHDDEELRLASAWRAKGDTVPLLVIAPRHPQRGEALRQALDRAGVRYAVRSRGEWPAAGDQAYLADTFGELEGFMAGAELVFMGGSLVPHGGQNLLEPARLGRALLAGPHLHNFADEAALLEGCGALQRVEDAHAVARTAQAWLADPDALAARGRRGRAEVVARADMARRYLDALAEWSLPCLNRGHEG
ncbi:3-deoxy-D-manno-octulosonic-acid transferase [Alkalispirillum mobile]|uniref:3-deoxy-D-manno-octulosonic acid transferase n=1 Tax=Alkalispirillum mobile TaxID=85925 RepID=A0A498BTX3_9GAMM|nr:3-deoxy-D-manno-octulosonic acid transferase [Alkalispirillum mobile]RLK47145.1 3-deoxy-D-manno-octulosonic-acid transferase [Alkalispirillum mobile]